MAVFRLMSGHLCAMTVSNALLILATRTPKVAATSPAMIFVKEESTVTPSTAALPSFKSQALMTIIQSVVSRGC